MDGVGDDGAHLAQGVWVQSPAVAEDLLDQWALDELRQGLKKRPSLVKSCPNSLLLEACSSNKLDRLLPFLAVVISRSKIFTTIKKLTSIVIGTQDS